MRCCCTAITTIRRPGRYGAVISRILKLSGTGDDSAAGRHGADSVSAADPPRGRTRSRTGPIAMFDNFPLWPAQASSGAANVDALYVFLLVLSAVHVRGDFQPDPGLCDQVPAPPGRRGRADRRLHAARTDLVDHSDVHLPVYLRLGRGHLLPGAHAAAGCDRSLRGGQAVDVEAAASKKASARSTSCTCRWAATSS